MFSYRSLTDAYCPMTGKATEPGVRSVSAGAGDGRTRSDYLMGAENVLGPELVVAHCSDELNTADLFTSTWIFPSFIFTYFLCMSVLHARMRFAWNWSYRQL